MIVGYVVVVGDSVLNQTIYISGEYLNGHQPHSSPLLSQATIYDSEAEAIEDMDRQLLSVIRFQPWRESIPLKVVTLHTIDERPTEVTPEHYERKIEPDL